MALLVFAAPLPGSGAATQVGNASETSTPPAGGAEKTITLVTGDTVTVREVGGQPAATVKAGPGRSSVGFHTRKTDRSLYVVPSDAMSLLSSGRLDPALFDVRALADFGYDDAKLPALPLIVVAGNQMARAAGELAALPSVSRTRRLPAIGGVALTVSKEATETFWSSVTGEATTLANGMDRIWLDGLLRPTLDETVPQVGAPAAWQAGHTGTGVKVAVLDTGVDAGHPDLAGKVAEARDFTGGGSLSDDVGHGTHVASTIAGSGAASSGRYKGVAPGATILSGRVCEVRGCPFSAIIDGMTWAAAEQHAKVVNMSLGAADTPGLDPLETAVNQLSAAYGTLFVVSAGNNGADGAETIGSPGSADAALTVGAVDKQDGLAPFSSRGPRLGEDTIKPDITAPGVDVVAARAANAFIGTPVGDRYLRASGTSMAAPHVAGAAAILAGQYPAWTGGRLKAALTGSAQPHAEQTVYEQGAGRLDVARAAGQTVTADTASVRFGTALWPHDDDEPITRTVTYRNHGTASVTLGVGIDVTGPGGAAAPAGMFTATPGTVTVPAGGEAVVTLTADTRRGGPDGRYVGRVTAIGGATRVVTPIVVTKEVESYNLTLKHVDRNGEAPEHYATVLDGIDQQVPCYRPGRPMLPGEWFSCVRAGPDGAATLRLPRARYTVTTTIGTTQDGVENYSVVGQPLVRLVADTTIVLDSRVAKPVRITVPRASARPEIMNMSYYRRVTYQSDPTTWPIGGFQVEWDPRTGRIQELFTAGLGPAVEPGDLRVAVSGSWADPGPARDFTNSSYSYHLVWDRRLDRLPTGFTATVRDRDLAEVKVDLRGAMPNKFGYKQSVAWAPDSYVFYGNVGWVHCALPCTRTEFYSPGPRFGKDFYQLPNRQSNYVEVQQSSAWVTHTAGEPKHEVWNGAVFGPSMPSSGIIRKADRLEIHLPMFSDSDPSHDGYARATGRTTLWRNGEKFTEWARPPFGTTIKVDVPADTADYRLETEVDYSAVSTLSTQTKAAWSFRSGHAIQDPGEPVPMSAVRFSPRLDRYNQAPAGQAFLVPVTVEHPPPAGPPKALAVDVSYDDGTTWKPASLIRGSGNQAVLVRHPAGAAYVSLRTRSVDTHGNKVEQTSIRAYALKPHNG